MKVGLCDVQAVCVSVYSSLLIYECLNHGMYIMALESISTAYFINPSHQSVCLYMYPPTVARQHLGKKVAAARNTHLIIEGFLLMSFSMVSVSYQGT
jgi:hypothetical protein